jgi:hypothetical protein
LFEWQQIRDSIRRLVSQVTVKTTTQFFLFCKDCKQETIFNTSYQLNTVDECPLCKSVAVNRFSCEIPERPVVVTPTPNQFVSQPKSPPPIWSQPFLNDFEKWVMLNLLTGGHNTENYLLSNESTPLIKSVKFTSLGWLVSNGYINKWQYTDPHTLELSYYYTVTDLGRAYLPFTCPQSLDDD